MADPRPDARLLAAVRREVVEQAAGHPGGVDLEAAVRRAAGVLGAGDERALVQAVRAELGGAGALQPLLEDEAVCDVLVNGPQEVWVDRGAGLERVDLDLGTSADVRGLAVRLAASGGQRLDDASPMVDARLPDGTRLHAVLPPVAPAGAVISLRVLRRVGMSVADLTDRGTLTPTVAAVLRGLVRARANLLVSGATGTGKTTLLGALLALVPHDERIVCIEEAGELDPVHPHVVRLVVRRANVEGTGEVGLSDLVRTALRMRPDRIVLGECRGAEVREVLTALNTGHEGACATVHANTVQDVPARLEALGALAGMSRDALAAQAVSAVHAVVHLRRSAGVRRVSQIGVVGRGRDGALEVDPVLEVRSHGGVAVGPGWAGFVRRWGLEAEVGTR